MSAFMQGLQTGSQVAQGWMDTYENARKRRQAEMLEQQRQGILTAQPEEFQGYTEQQGQELSRLAESGQVDIGYDQDRGAYTVTPRGLAPEARTPNMTSVVAPQSRRRFLGQDYSPEDLTPTRTQRLREQAMVDTIADPIERQRGLQNLRQAEAADLQLSEAKNAALLRENTQKAQALVAEQTAAGQILDVPALSKIAADTGADAQELIRGAASALNLTNAQAEAKTKKLVADINKAATSPEAFNKLLGSFDPNPDDNITPELRIGKDGMHQVFYGDKPMSPAFRGTKDISAMSLVASHYSDQVSGNPLATAVQLATLEAKRAQIAASNRASPGTPSLSQKIADAEKALKRALTAEEKSIMAGLANRPGLGGDKPVEVPEAGIRVMVNGQLRVTDGEGGYVALGGVVPAERAAFLQQAGVPDNLIGQIDWSPDGRTVGFGGKQYDPRNPRDIRELNDDYERLGVNTNRVIEAQRNTPQRGLGAQPDQSGMPLYFAP